MDPKRPTYPLRRKQAHQKIREDLERLIEIAAGDTLAEWALAGIMNLLGDLLPLDKDWQSMHVKNFATTEEQQIIWDEDARLEHEGARMYGRAGKILSRNPHLEKLLSDVKDPERYVNDIKRKKYEK